MRNIKEQITVSMDRDLLKKAKEMASRQSRSIASVFREALILFLEKNN